MKYILILLLFASPAFAWGSITHEALAAQVCNDFNCGCLNETIEGSTMPDKVFHDNVNHIYYNPETCNHDSEYYICPIEYNDVALVKTNDYLEQARDISDCDRWQMIGIASHYFFDSKNIFHQVREEGYCHSSFEEKVDDSYNNNKTDWVVSTCGEAVTSLDMNVWVKEFEDRLSFVQQTHEPLTLRPPTIQDIVANYRIFVALFLLVLAYVVYNLN